MTLIILYYEKLNEKFNGYIVGVLLFFFFNTSIFSQINAELQQLPLSEIIILLEERFQYEFTYADDTIKDVFIKNIPQEYTFMQTLDFLRQETKLMFTVINSNFVSINRFSESFLICGIIYSRGTMTPLKEAVISGNKSTAISDEKGYFELEVTTSKEMILISHLGFKVTYQPSSSFKKKNCKSIYLDRKTEVLTEVILNNYLDKGIHKTDNGNFKIDYSNFRMLPGLIETDVLQTIQALPGIQSVRETVSNINIRGGTHDQNLILWDGIKMYQSGHFLGLISVFNPSITKDATLIKNGTSTEYSDGVSGTILMNTDSEINSDFRGSVSANLIDSNAFIDIPISKKSSLQLSGRRSINDFIKPTYSKYFDRISQDVEIQDTIETHKEFNFYDVNLRWNTKISDKERFRVNFLMINDKLVFNEHAKINSIVTSRESSLRQSSIAEGFWYQKYWNNRFVTSFQIYETDYTIKSVNANFQGKQRFFQRNKVSETGAKINTYFTIRENINWLNGCEFIETGVANLDVIDAPVYRKNKNEILQTYSLFSQMSYKNRKSHNSINFGLKYSYNNKIKTHILEPRLSYNQKLFKYFNIEILGEFKHQNISQFINFQNEFLGIEKRRWVLANDKDIPIIRSKQVSLGVHYDKNRWLISAEGYCKIVKGITARSQGFHNQYEFKNAIGEYSIKGIDFLINKRYDNASTWISYSCVDNRYLFPTFKEREFPNNIDIRHSLTLGMSYTINDFKIAVGLNWHSGIPTTRPYDKNPILNQGINYEPVNSSRLKQYLRLDFSSSYEYTLNKDIKIQAGIAIWNFSDTHNIINTNYKLTKENKPIEVVKQSLGITPNATFKVLF
ncbi:TonB-dependent receptor plug domain-containing protein [Aquimarina longa]|uniref:TonB-dependent receptor plug domain-containing protein n=1 Tax=Aquimarina longa TaxID=1080221 RepID=UPI0007835957|nr:TonB-dependent receptor plug domain-containing protein [Aquimarina longa]